jgi:hypothetical protein
VTLQRLLPDGLATDTGDDDLDGRLALAKPRHANRRCHVAGGVLEGVLEVGRRDLDIQADAAFGELLDGGLHSEPFCQKGPELPGGLQTWWKSMTTRSGLCSAWISQHVARLSPRSQVIVASKSPPSTAWVRVPKPGVRRRGPS